MIIKLKTQISFPRLIQSEYHKGLPTNNNRGLCISFYAPDELDKKAVEFAKTLNPHTSLAVDLGCSCYFPQAIRFAKLGIYTDAFDISPPISEYNEVNNELNHKINYIQTSLTEDISKFISQKKYNLIYSNRFISHIPYHKALQLFDSLWNQSATGCRFFISFGNLVSDEAQIYADRDKSLEERFCVQNTTIAQKNQLLQPVCLYTRKDIYDHFLKDYSIKVIDEISGKSSIKLIFEKI